MTNMWDKWGRFIPLTVLHVDRVQVTQVKEHPIESDKLQVQLGMGEENLKKLKKPQIGHLMKNDIPPKKVLKEFTISKENVLPVGYMMSVRHFTVG